MNNETTKKITGIGVLTALYVVLSALMKIPFIGNVSLDLGYIVFAVAILKYNYWGIIVGVVGCMLESILFSAYGFSISWAVMNLIIGVICAFTATRAVNNDILNSEINSNCMIAFSIITVVAVIIGGLAKGIIECLLYNIPWIVKLPKIGVAILMDSICMIIGNIIWFKTLWKVKY